MMHRIQLNSLNKFIKRITCYLVCFVTSYNAISQSHNWQSFPFKLNGSPRFFFDDTLTNKLVIGGNFDKVDTVTNNFFLWNGTNVSFIKSNQLMPWPPVCANRFYNKLYVGGFPSNCGIYLWNDTNLLPLSNTRELISTFYNYHDTLLIGGFFDSISGVKAGPIAYLNNNKWSSLYGIDTVIGLDIYNNFSSITSIVEYKDDLYAAGNIDNFGSLKEILRWHNGKWTDVGGGLGSSGDDWVHDMVVYKGELYVAGRFFRNGGAADNCIVRWDGVKWKPVGGGVEGTEITDLQVFNNELWAVGKFWNAGGVPAQWIAKWNGYKWCGLGNTFDNAIGCMGVYNNELYIGGGFRTIDGDSSMAYIAKWIGGNYTDTCGFVDYSGVSSTNQKQIAINIYPNPTTHELHIQTNSTEKLIAQFFDITGKQVKENTSINNSENINTQNFSEGIYYLRIIDVNYHLVKIQKVVVIK